MTREHASKDLRGALADGGTLEEAALHIARDVQPRLVVDDYLGRLDGIADDVVRRLDRSSMLDEQIVALRAGIYVDAGLRGNREAYYDARNSYLNEVLDRRLGIPISLAVVVLAVARRAGVVAEGVGFPGHFLVRIGGPGGRLTDPFDGLRPLSSSDLSTLARRLVGPNTKISATHLEVTPPRGILIRMLSNLRAIHEKAHDHARALVVCDRLVELGAGPPARRDRGMHALALGAGGAAQADLLGYLEAVPDAPDRVDVEAAMARAARATAWS